MMMSSQQQPPLPANAFQVVINHEEQYSIWPDGKPIPPKWRPAGFSGSKEECLDYVKRVWSDMRPLSVRQHDRTGDGTGGQEDT
jgi:MbtH protein